VGQQKGASFEALFLFLLLTLQKIRCKYLCLENRLPILSLLLTYYSFCFITGLDT